MVLWSGILGSGSVMGVEPSWMALILLQRDSTELPCPFCQVMIHWEV